MGLRAISEACRQRATQPVLYSDPPISSPAALVLLNKQLFSKDRTIYRNNKMSRLRDRWMKLQLKKPDAKGGLTCAICGKLGLNPFTSDKNMLATLDHIIPLNQNGVWNDTNNFQVACFHCNCNRL